MKKRVWALLLAVVLAFSVLAGWIILGQAMSVREGLGCLLVFGGIILAQLPERNRSES